MRLGCVILHKYCSENTSQILLREYYTNTAHCALKTLFRGSGASTSRTGLFVLSTGMSQTQEKGCMISMSRCRPRRWSIFRAMRCRWFIFQLRCDTDYFLEKLNIAIVAIIFLDHRERLFFDYFAHFRTNYFAIIH